MMSPENTQNEIHEDLSTGISFEQSPHDAEHPFTMVSNALIRDASISPNCRWLIIYLRSNSPGWKISMIQLRKHLKGFIGRDKLRSIVDEAEKAGYMKRVEYKYNGNLLRTRYLVSEFKKFVRHTDPQAAEGPAPEEASSKEEQAKEEQAKELKEISKDISLVEDLKSSTKQTKKSVQVEAIITADTLWRKILAICPNHKPPRLDKWAEELDLMSRRDHRSWDQIEKVIEWAFEDAFWAKVLQAPKGLRNNFDTIWAKMTPVDNRGGRMVKNRSMAHEAKSAVKTNEKKWKNFFIADSKVVRLDTNEEIPLDLESQIFESQMIRIFGLTKV